MSLEDVSMSKTQHCPGCEQSAREIERLRDELFFTKAELDALGNTDGERESFEREAHRHGNTLHRINDGYYGRQGSEWYWWKLAWRSAVGSQNIEIERLREELAALRQGEPLEK